MHVLNKPIIALKKEAKALLRDITNGDRDALVRVAAVHTFVGKARPITLMNAQHVIAKEYGFEKWDAVSGATDDQLRCAIAAKRGDRKYNLATQERIRVIFRELGIDFSEEALRQPIHVLAFWRISGGYSADPYVAAQIARDNELANRWAVDVAHYQTGMSDEQARALKERLDAEKIPYWNRRRNLGAIYQYLKHPSVMPSRMREEIREKFGDPVVA